MDAQLRSPSFESVVLLRKEPLFSLVEASVQGVASMNTFFAVYPTTPSGTVLKIVDWLLSLLCTKETVNAALELLVLARLASDYPIGVEGCISSDRCMLAQRFFSLPDLRRATELDATSKETVLENKALNKALNKDEIDRTGDQCMPYLSEMLLQGPVRESDNSCGACSSEWMISAAKGKGEASNGHSKTDKVVASGKKNQEPEDEDEEEEDQDNEGEGRDEDEEDEDDEDEAEEDGGEEEEEQEEDDEEEDDEEEGVPVSVPVSRRAQIVEDDADSEEGEDEEAGVEDEDDFEDDEEDEDGEEDEDEEEDEEDSPPKKKSKA